MAAANAMGLFISEYVTQAQEYLKFGTPIQLRLRLAQENLTLVRLPEG
ncbi:hypothetical protein CORAM0001_1032 [Corynebacterium amycolatum SK46]|nr:hypothetical protein CORAM0001_1032 [Corynebacterium amycolatum SK46]